MDNNVNNQNDPNDVVDWVAFHPPPTPLVSLLNLMRTKHASRGIV